ncbi:tetratricopeptide repeat protein [Thermodesulfatator atlanticus]|uniref:tetratricopeptide repeat protein n=1 Tax=Thermodesulfatator atlanticus TaxID=501497 RepID=UPI0003B3473B|nr:tetratricopeptide repeat protein [Thermodesulfatator atlanticus]
MDEEKIQEKLKELHNKAQVPEEELDDETKARKWLEEAKVMWGQGRSLDALERAEEALKIFLDKKLYREAVNAAEVVGDIKFFRERFEEALKPYKMALDICEEFEDEISAALIAEKIIFVYQKMGEAQKALPYLYRCLEIAEKYSDAHRAARMMAGIGDVKKLGGEIDAAREAYEIALKIYKGLGARDQAKLVEEALASLSDKLGSGETTS